MPHWFAHPPLDDGFGVVFGCTRRADAEAAFAAVVPSIQQVEFRPTDHALQHVPVLSPRRRNRHDLGARGSGARGRNAYARVRIVGPYKWPRWSPLHPREQQFPVVQHLGVGVWHRHRRHRRRRRRGNRGRRRGRRRILGFVF